MKKSIQLKITIDYNYPNTEDSEINNQALVSFINDELKSVSWGEFMPSFSDREDVGASTQFNIVIYDGKQVIGRKRFKHANKNKV